MGSGSFLAQSILHHGSDWHQTTKSVGEKYCRARKVLSSKVPKGSNRLKIALRNAANAIGNLKESTPLRDFFQRINFRKGRVSAISATARKLAVIIWNMVVKGTPYINPEGYLFLDQKRKLGIVKRIQKQIAKFELTADDLQIIKT